MSEKKVEAWRIISDFKNGLVSQVVEEIGESVLDASRENVKVFAIDHRCNEGLWGTLGVMNKDGFMMGDDFDGIQLPWKDMIVEDLAMVLDYLRTGHW